MKRKRPADKPVSEILFPGIPPEITGSLRRTMNIKPHKGKWLGKDVQKASQSSQIYVLMWNHPEGITLKDMAKQVRVYPGARKGVSLNLVGLRAKELRESGLVIVTNLTKCGGRSSIYKLIAPPTNSTGRG